MIYSCMFLLVSNFVCIVIASQRYPYVLPKCCEPDGIPSVNGVSKEPDESSTWKCSSKGVEYILLPTKLFPEMSTDAKYVKVELQNLVNVLQCEDGRRYSYRKQLHESTPFVNSTKNKDINDITFSGVQLSFFDGHIYTPSNFCISSRTTNKTQLALQICKQKCSSGITCIPRCCGGHQSVLTTLPTFSNESFYDFCSSPTTINDSWDPWASEIVIVKNRFSFHQVMYASHKLGFGGHSIPQKNCRLLAFTETPLMLLEDGRLQVTVDNKTKTLEDFCIDGINGSTGISLPGASKDKCDVLEEKEVVVAYVCSPQKIPSIPSPPTNQNYTIALTACACLANPPANLTRIPWSFKLKGGPLVPYPLVSLTTGEYGGSLQCPYGHENITEEYKTEEENETEEEYETEEEDDREWLLVHRESGESLYIITDMFCIRSVYHNAMTLRICKELELSWWDYLTFILLVPLFIALFLSPLFYVVIAVVYILRKDKELILRCGTICYALSMAFYHLVFVSKLFFRAYIDVPQSFLSKHFTLVILMMFFSRYTFTWMCALCFDFWLTITFHCPLNKRIMWLWGYIAFTLSIPAVWVLIVVLRVENLIGPKEWLSYVVHALKYGPLSINCLLFLATTVKLWIGRHSSSRLQIKSFLFYSKLFFLMLLDSIIEHLMAFVHGLNMKYFQPLEFGLLILMLLHPIMSFFLLVWNEESQRYLGTKYPRVKRALDIIVWIGYPVRKCLGLCRRCKPRHNVGTNGEETLETFLCSTDSHFHARQDSDIQILT